MYLTHLWQANDIPKQIKQNQTNKLRHIYKKNVNMNMDKICHEMKNLNEKISVLTWDITLVILLHYIKYASVHQHEKKN